MTTELGDFVYRRRRALGLTQSDLAKKMGGNVGHSTIANIERGFDYRTGRPNRPKPETLRGLADALETPYAELARIAGYGDVSSYREARKEGVAWFEGAPLDEEEQRVIRALRAAKDRQKKSPGA